jgi:hypothetical protein
MEVTKPQPCDKESIPVGISEIETIVNEGTMEPNRYLFKPLLICP